MTSNLDVTPNLQVTPSLAELGERRALRAEIFRLALPAALQNLLHVAVLFVDTKMVAWYAAGDPVELAALGLAGPLVWSVTVIFSVTSIGATAVVARRIGEGSDREAARATSTALLMGGAVGALVSVIGLFASSSIIDFFVAFGENPEGSRARVPAIGYLGWILVLFPFKAVAMHGEAALRGAGDTRSPLFAGVLGNLANVTGNAIFIFGLAGAPELGVAGAGLGTALGGVVECLAVIWVLTCGWRSRLRLSGRERMGFDPRWGRAIGAVSFPALIDALVFHSGFLVYQLAIYKLSEAAIAAHRVAITLESVAFMPAVGFSVSAASLSGRLLGAGQPELAARAARDNLRTAVAVLLPVAVAVFLCADSLARFFSDSPEVWPLAALCLRISAGEIPFLVATTALTGTLRGAGATRDPVYVTLLGTWFIRVPLAWALGVGTEWGLAGIWWATLVDWFVRACLLAWLVRRGTWRLRQL